MRKNHDKMMAELLRGMEQQDFKSKEEAQQYLDNVVKEGIPSAPRQILSEKEQAEDLVFDAYEMTPDKAKANIEMALLLDPECISAYEFLGDIEDSVPVSMVFFEKGITIGRKIFGGKFLEENKGHFWGLFETRPFMRCMQQQADCLQSLGKIKDSLAILEEMLELNPADNQGSRVQTLLFLAQLGDKEKFEKYDKMFEEDDSAFACFSRALFAFKTEGETDHSNKLLAVAIGKNPYISRRLLSPRTITVVPNSYTLGSKEEATCYGQIAKQAWKDTEGALRWLRKRTSGSSKK